MSTVINILFKRNLFTVIVLIGCTSLNAQNHVFNHYSVEDGLPSSQVYSAFQDSKGYMWFATDAGVSRFNGYEFENFDTDDGLTDNTVFLVTEDYKGRIWFGTFNLKLSYLYNDSIIPYKYNNEIAELELPKKAIESFYVDSNDNVWLSFITDGIHKIDKNGKTHQMIIIPDTIDWVNSIIQVEDQLIAGSLASQNFNIQKFKGINFPLQQLSEYKGSIYFVNQANHYEYKTTLRGTMLQNSLLLVRGKEITLVNKNNQVQKMFSPIDFSRLYSIMGDEKFIWLCQGKEGVYKCIIKDDKLVIVERFLENQSVSRVYKDRNNGYWFMTLKEGIYYLSNDLIYTRPEKSIVAIEVDTTTGNRYIAFENEVIKIEKGSIKRDTLVKNLENIVVLRYDYFNHRLNIGYSHSSIITIDITEEYGIYNTKAFLMDSTIVYNGYSYGLYISKNGQIIYNSANNEQPVIWCTSLTKNKDAIWIATNEGVRIYKDETITNPFKKNKYLSSSITDIQPLSEGVLLLGTKKYGVLIVQNDSVIDIIEKVNGLAGNLVKAVHIDNQKVIWVGTNKGLSRIDYRNNGEYQIYNLTRKHGLISEEIVDITSYKNTIYVATSKELLEFDKTKIKVDTTPVPIHITNLLVNKENRDAKEHIQLTYQENFMDIYYEALNYKAAGVIEYQYRMLGIDSNWITTYARTVQYPYLQPADYVFEVKAKNEDGLWSSPAKITFTIFPPFWLTWWFKITVFTLLIGLIYIGFKVNVLAYNKHVQQELLKRLLKKIGKQSYIFIEIDKRKTRIKESDILFVEAFKNYVEINTMDKKYLCRSTMKNMEEKLSVINFVRIHRSFIVQKDKIDSIAEEYIIIQKKQIPIGVTYQTRLKELKKQFFTLNT